MIWYLHVKQFTQSRQSDSQQSCLHSSLRRWGITSFFLLLYKTHPHMIGALVVGGWVRVGLGWRERINLKAFKDWHTQRRYAFTGICGCFKKVLELFFSFARPTETVCAKSKRCWILSRFRILQKLCATYFVKWVFWYSNTVLPRADERERHWAAAIVIGNVGSKVKRVKWVCHCGLSTGWADVNDRILWKRYGLWVVWSSIAIIF